MTNENVKPGVSKTLKEAKARYYSLREKGLDHDAAFTAVILYVIAEYLKMES